MAEILHERGMAQDEEAHQNVLEAVKDSEQFANIFPLSKEIE
jgi:hypothetical protein